MKVAEYKTKHQRFEVKNWTRFRLLPRTARHSQFEPPVCSLCGQEIKIGQKYFDGGFGKRAHQLCVAVERKTR